MEIFDKSIPMHVYAVDWAIERGYLLSVTDRDAEPGEWDIEMSDDREAILEACRATELPNVAIFNRIEGNGEVCTQHVTTFSVIDEGIPGETINDYTIGNNAGEFDAWFSEMCGKYWS